MFLWHLKVKVLVFVQWGRREEGGMEEIGLVIITQWAPEGQPVYRKNGFC